MALTHDHKGSTNSKVRRRLFSGKSNFDKSICTECITLCQKGSTLAIFEKRVRVLCGKDCVRTSKKVLWADCNAVSTALRDKLCIGRKNFQNEGEQSWTTLSKYLLQASWMRDISLARVRTGESLCVTSRIVVTNADHCTPWGHRLAI